MLTRLVLWSAFLEEWDGLIDTIIILRMNDVICDFCTLCIIVLAEKINEEVRNIGTIPYLGTIDRTVRLLLYCTVVLL